MQKKDSERAGRVMRERPASRAFDVHKYQSLEAWKRAHRAALVAHRATDAAYHPKSRDLFNQIRRAAASVEANVVEGYALGTTPQFIRDRKSTRLNSSHSSISYAVFCLKKKKKTTRQHNKIPTT